MRKWQDFINHLKHRGGDFIIDGFNCYIDFQEENGNGTTFIYRRYTFWT